MSSDESGNSSSSSDDNDSHAAAHAAAIGHSPKPTGTVPTEVPVADLRTINENGMDSTLERHESKESLEEAAALVVSSLVANAGGAAGSATEKAEEEETPEQAVEDDTDIKMTDVPRSIGETESTPVLQSDQHDSQFEQPSNGVVPVAASDHVDSAQDETAPQQDATEETDASRDAETEVRTPANKELLPMVDTVGKPSVENGNSKIKASKKSKKKASKPKEPYYYCPYDLNERDEDENTPLHVAIHARKVEHVKYLLEANASLHKKCDGSAPVHTAISIGAIPTHAEVSYELTVLLAEGGADLTVRDDSFQTPLYLACMYNLPSIVGYILTEGEGSGLSTLNLKSDRSGGRALHAAAKFDMPPVPGAVGTSHHHARTVLAHHHPDGTIAHSGNKHLPGVIVHAATSSQPSQTESSNTEVVVDLQAAEKTISVTQVLLTTSGIEIDSKNNYGQTPLHVACMRGNWPVVRLLLGSGSNPHVADRRGFTPGQLAYKRGMPIPNDLLPVLGEASASSNGTPPRDLIVDPDNTTLMISHEMCILHRTCPPIRRDGTSEPPPENVRRLHVLLNEQEGILRGTEFSECTWEGECRRAAMADVLKIHEYPYVESISQMCSSIPDHPSAIANLDADTAVSRWTFEAALRAAGGVCEAVDRVVAGDFRNAFCPVRPPGHHAGPRGIVRCENDPDGGSAGFCFLNNVAVGAAYARTMYRNDGIRKIAIIDFDVHHGNGTEEIIRQLVPTQEKSVIRTPFATGEFVESRYRPWLDETDMNDVFFASTHGYGPRGVEFAEQPQQGGWFYPASGKPHTTDAILNPSVAESPNVSDFLLSQTWSRMGEESRSNCCKIINCGLGLPPPDAIPGMQRVEMRDAYRKKILPHLRDFDPDIIFISAGFDAHKKDSMNFGYVGMVEDDYEWVTGELVKIANTCCNGRIVSVLEGGYKIHGGIVSPFARSVASHARALVDGGRSRELYDAADGEWDSQFERHTVEERERRRQQKLDRLSRAQEETRRHIVDSMSNAGEREEADLMKEPLNDHPPLGENSDLAPDQPARKRRRNQVDYKELFEQMKREETN